MWTQAVCGKKKLRIDPQNVDGAKSKEMNTLFGFDFIFLEKNVLFFFLDQNGKFLHLSSDVRTRSAKPLIIINKHWEFFLKGKSVVAIVERDRLYQPTFL